MDLLLAGSNLTPYDLLEDFESCIWTDRYSSNGEFKLTISSKDFQLLNLADWKFLLSSESNKVMMIENVVIPRQKSGERLVEVSGRSIEAFLNYRTNTTNTSEEIGYQGSVADIVRQIMDRYAINTIVNVTKFPYLKHGYYAPGTSIKLAVKRDIIYQLVKTLCDSDNLGFAINHNSDNTLSFNVYRGLDATDPTTVYYKEYSAEMGTLINTSYLQSIQDYRTHARVEGKRVMVDVYRDGFSSASAGFDRRTIVVDAADIGTEESIPWQDDVPLLIQRGKEVLGEVGNGFVNLVDGDIPVGDLDIEYFGLGDMVMVKDSYGNRTKKRITEQVWSVDKTGYRRTPTFSDID